jgi:hypothetical protein
MLDLFIIRTIILYTNYMWIRKGNMFYLFGDSFRNPEKLKGLTQIFGQ